ncbi:FliM/FliN family flagellar motor C-terminal domain-containing protein [Xinfangfangia sp. CPCC 101601]|uniref:FliM/FliN family flagellar motor C-terminal domain-containing protein n=1 Tax=Pseudogemmobacter lacusdianii TaxID=3069608 RepID=A0ABU0VYG0_9RHOB|nr:FliM/FliN family flagellar motor C-terminal domain-containing protein [Xinfangfangia sp. CPCC 101601]MDQ2066767.1 FliM/FliN family flagellar motor C-terminal domain-containing protein [Xinfangfangia sp. CPCC 101601]
MNGILQRKVAQAKLAEGPTRRAGPGVDPNWRLAFARAARDCTGLLVEVTGLRLLRQSLAELLELPPERALLAMLDGPKAGLGVMMLSSQLMAALIEMQTTGRVSTQPALPRRPTRTDAAMVAGTLDRALQELEVLMEGQPDLIWTGGFRYASFLEDARPLGLLLEDHPYRVMVAQISFADGARQGELILALPAEGRFSHPLGRAGPLPSGAAAADLPLDLADAVQSVACQLQGVIGRMTLPLQQVMALQVDEVLSLPDAALDRIQLETIDGRRLARARLGQNRGMRALRLEEAEGAAGRTPVATAQTSAVGLPEAGVDGMALGVGSELTEGLGMGQMAAFAGMADLDGAGLGLVTDPAVMDAGADFPGFALDPEADGGLRATG